MRALRLFFPLEGGIPVFLKEPAAVVAMEHRSNPIGAQFEEILREGRQFVLNIGAGATETKKANCVEFEHKIFRHTDVVGDAHYLPFRDSVFDHVFAFNVFEHLREPSLAAGEIRRVLKPGGVASIHTAFLQALHEEPIHFYNATEFGVREWFSSFEIESCHVSGNFGPGVMLGYLITNVLETARMGAVPADEQMLLSKTTLGEWAEYWRRNAGPPPGFEILQGLRPDLQKRIAAGFELIARKPADSSSGAPCRRPPDDYVRPLATDRKQEEAGQISVRPDAARTQVSKQFFLWLDEPLAWEPKVRRLRLSGWVVAKRGEPITAIRVVVRGRIFGGRFDRDRPEVAKHVGIPDAPRWCGFTVDVRVPFGRGRIELQVARADGRWQKAYARDVWGPVLASAAERASWRKTKEADAARHFAFWFDRPADWSQPTRHLHVSGWCIDRLGGEIQAIRARIGARKMFPAHYGAMRPDVAIAAGSNAALRSGFALDVVVPSGRSTLVLEARNTAGEWEQVFTTRITGPTFWPRIRQDAMGDYAAWIESYDRLRRDDEKHIRHQIADFSWQPTISILVPAYNTEPRWLRRAIESVRAQLYEKWELCLVDDASSAPHVWKLLQKYAARDPRIKVLRRPENGHISAASNDALRPCDRRVCRAPRS